MRARLLAVTPLVICAGCGLLPVDEVEREPVPEPEASSPIQSDRELVQAARALILERDLIGPEELGELVLPLSFDRSRTEVIALALPRMELVTGEDLVQFLSWVRLDSSRKAVLEAVLPELEIVLFSDALAASAQFLDDAGRILALRSLVDFEDAFVSDAELLQAVRLGSSEASRLELLRTVVPLLEGTIDLETARELLGGFAYDGTRIAALELLRDELHDLPYQEREQVISLLDQPETRRRAREILE
ncbi:MAG: hypothetical protein V2A76_00190 [Planctomycetota bacterium]